MPETDRKGMMPEDLKRCVEFHGHICPGLIYDYRVAREAMKLLNLSLHDDSNLQSIKK